MQKTDVIGPRGIGKTSQLLTVNGFIKIAMEKGILDIKLVDWLGVRGGNGEDHWDG